jgi:Family of unknown function (DUF6152)
MLVKTKLLQVVSTLIVGFLVATVPVFAHHGAVAYDEVKVVTISGTVTSFQFINPHCIVSIDAKDSSGNVQKWTVETPPPSMMKHNAGWYRDMMKAGDQIRVDLHTAKNGSNVGKIAGSGNMILNGKPIQAASE